MGRNRLSQSTRLAPRLRITLRLMLYIVYPASFLIIAIFLLQFEPSPKEEVLQHKDVKEILAEEGWRSFMS